jgi:hypothetical protein
VPDSLRVRLEEAIRTYGPRVANRPVPDALEQIAESLITDAKSAPVGSRETAMMVLAADAMITFACEAVAELDPGQLAEFR